MSGRGWRIVVNRWVEVEVGRGVMEGRGEGPLRWSVTVDVVDRSERAGLCDGWPPIGGKGRRMTPPRHITKADHQRSVSMTSPEPLPQLLTIDDVARRLGTSVRHIRRLVAEQRIPFVKVGWFVRFEPDEVAAWIGAHRVESRRTV